MLHCAGFISADSLYMFRASGAHHQEYLKTGTAATGACVMVAGRSSRHHIRDETKFIVNEISRNKVVVPEGVAGLIYQIISVS